MAAREPGRATVTVGAIILAASAESALSDAEGLPRVRRLADVAWSGGAIPVVVVAVDPDGGVAAALAGAPVTLGEPAPMAGGPVAQIARGIDIAVGQVADTDAALVWPVRMAWVGPETVTSLIEAHGLAPGAVLRPAYEDEPGWPVLVPVALLSALRALAPDRMPDELIADLAAGGAQVRHLDLGDPGSTHDGATPRSALPPYVGPAEPGTGHVHEWGAAAADRPDDEPLEAPPTVRVGPGD